MRIAFICKRRYMGKDVIADRYARLYEIPAQLAQLGHDVHGFCFSYQGGDDGMWTHDLDVARGGLSWESRALSKTNVATLFGYPSHLLSRLRTFAPDVLIGASDIPHVVLGAWLSRKLAVPYAADLYDNFEGFGQARIPGMVRALRHAVRGATLVTTTSEPLKELVVNTYQARGEVLAMPSTVDKAIFRPLDRNSCRRAMGLPESACLIGTAGGLHQDKGVGTLYRAWQTISAQSTQTHLVLAGPVNPRFPPPTGPRVHYLGQLPHARTAELFNALDVGVIYLRDTIFGRYCFPQKAYEMLACGLPIAAARVGVMPYLLSETSQGLYRADDANDLARAALAQLDHPERADVAIDDWTQIIKVMEQRLRTFTNAA